jgi:uncharacterized protein (DUF1330 family)
MGAYVIVDIEILNPVEYEAYKKLTPASIAVYNGKFIVRGGATEVLEGDVKPGRVVVIEFPTTKLAKDWWSSKEYSEAKNIRQHSAKTNMILVEGV